MDQQPTNRYSRQTILPQIRREGQEKLAAATVLVCGVGALGSSMAEMLARAGVGTLRLADRDYLELHNLQRQSLYTEADVAGGLPKAVAAARHIAEINSEVRVEPRVVDVTPDTMGDLLDGVAVALDGTDNLQTRYLLNDACVERGIPWVYSGVIGTSGVSLTVVPGRSACLRCLFPEEPAGDALPSCAQGGVLGPAAAVVAGLQAAEVVKEIVGFGRSLSGSLLLYDAAGAGVERVGLRRRPECAPGCARLAGSGAAA